MADAFNLANITPNIVYDLILGGVLASLFIPVFVEYLTTNDEEEAWHVANSVFNLTLLLLVTVSIALCIAAPYVIKAQTFLLHRDAARWRRTRRSCCGSSSSRSSSTASALSTRAYLTPTSTSPYPRSRRSRTTWSSSPRSASTTSTPSMYMLAIGATLGVVAMALIQLPWVRRTGFRYRPLLDLKHPAVRKLGRLAVPVIAYVLINQVGLWVVNILAAQVEGGISAYQYAYIFFQLPYGIVAVSIITALFPTLSEQSVRADTGRDGELGLARGADHRVRGDPRVRRLRDPEHADSQAPASAPPVRRQGHRDARVRACSTS